VRDLKMVLLSGVMAGGLLLPGATTAGDHRGTCSLPSKRCFDQEGATAVPLRQSIEVRHDDIFLSDLLDESAAENLRKQASNIVVGSAPPPGRVRRVSSQEIEEAIKPYPLLATRLSILGGANVLRWSRVLTRAEVLLAVDAVVDGKNLRVSHPLADSDIHFYAPVLVGTDSPTLKIESIEADLGPGITHIRLSISSEPQLPSFWVDVDGVIEERVTIALTPILPGVPVTSSLIRTEFRSVQSPDWTEHKFMRPLFGGVSRRAFRPGQTVPDDSIQPEILVRAGQTVQVVASSSGMRLTTAGTPLGNGHRGDRVRVRSIDNGRIFVGTVLGPHEVQVEFQ